MPDLQKSRQLKYHTVYQITNKNNGNIYVGAHSTNNLNDGYMGSGKLLRAAIEKYGIEQFEKCILQVYDTPEEMFAKESEIVTEEFVKRRDVYNIVTGGFGGFNRGSLGLRHITNVATGEVIAVDKSKIEHFLSEGWILGGKEANNKGKVYVHKNGVRRAVDKCELDSYLKLGWSKGYDRSPTSGKIWIYHKDNDQFSMCDETELELYLSSGWIRKKRSPLKKNSIWINNGKERKRISYEEFDSYYKKGWKRGRKL